VASFELVEIPEDVGSAFLQTVEEYLSAYLASHLRKHYFYIYGRDSNFCSQDCESVISHTVIHFSAIKKKAV
jgi:formamidopyrimidine-DNA glycosylase